MPSNIPDDGPRAVPQHRVLRWRRRQRWRRLRRRSRRPVVLRHDTGQALVPAVDPTNGAPAPKVVSASAAQKANAVEGSTETSAKPSLTTKRRTAGSRRVLVNPRAVPAGIPGTARAKDAGCQDTRGTPNHVLQPIRLRRPWQDVQAAEREDAQVELDLARSARNSSTRARSCSPRTRRRSPRASRRNWGSRSRP
jgi:hypothetical protein